MNGELHSRVTFRLYTDAKCFGPGVALLLEKVEEQHSLRAAAASVNMAYSKAWSIIKNCENSLGFKLLETTTGGKNGGGATLTPNARKLMQCYNEITSELRITSEKLFNEKMSWLKGS